MSVTPPNFTQLDYAQVIQNCYDETENRLRVDATATVTFPPSIAVSIDHTTDSIRLGDGTSYLTSTTAGSKVALDVAVVAGVVSGTFTQSGLSTAIKETVMTIGDTSTAVPTTSLLNRNTITVRVKGTNPVYFGSSAVTPTNGYIKYQNEEIFMDIKDNASVKLYAICDPGLSCEVRILELA